MRRFRRRLVHPDHCRVLNRVHQMHPNDCPTRSLRNQYQIVSLEKTHKTENSVCADLLAVAPHGDQFSEITRIHFAWVLIDAQLVRMVPIDVEHPELGFLVITTHEM